MKPVCWCRKAQHHDRDVVLEPAAAEALDFSDEPLLQLARGGAWVLPDDADHAGLSELASRAVRRLGQTVCVENQRIPGGERDVHLLVPGAHDDA